MLKIITVAFVLLVVAVLIYAATKPDTFRVQRSARIKATPDQIFPLINDLHAWVRWSPYEKKDPALKKSFGGSPHGPGAVYAWDGNGEVGKGSMTITDTSPPSLVRIQLDFIKPFAGSNIVEFSLEPEGEVTRVTWAMHGPMPFISKVMSVFFNMDTMIGKDFEAGLAGLRSVSES